MNEELVLQCAAAVRVACRRMSPQHLRALRESIEQACGLPKCLDWDRKATAHAEIVSLLADAAGDPALALLQAGDADGAAREMEQHLGVLLWMRRLSGRLDPARPVVTGSW